VIANSQGNRITPSVVAFTKEGKLVGEGAEVQRKLDPASAIYNAKRFIGRTWDDPIVRENAFKYPFKILQKNNKVQFQADCASKKLKKTFIQTPEEIAAIILSRMKKIAEDFLEESIEDVVVTVPAYFTDSQRQATIDAAKIAGLNVIRIINEPTAAAMAYGLMEAKKEDEQKLILVYDIGGGTFDVSVLEVEQDLILVRATAGNTNLGGEDFTTRLVKHFKKEIFQKHGIDLTPDHKAVARLKGACEKLKRNLSAENVTESKLHIDAFLQNGNDFISTMSRAKFENICQDLFNETIVSVEKVLKDAKLNKEDIDEVVLIGGSSRIPKLQSLLSKFFSNLNNNINSKILNKSINPDEAVACGAAVQAAILNNDPHVSVKDMLLMDVNPLSIGVNVEGDITYIVIERNTVIPVKKTFVGTTIRDNQSDVNIKITEGERSMTKDNTVLGAFILSEIPLQKAREPPLDTVFELDANGILTVSATVRLTGRKAGITLDTASSGKRSAEEINKLIEEAEKMKIADEAQENRALTMNKLTALCHHIKLASQEFPENDVADLLKDAEECISWIRKHPKSYEEQILIRHAALKHKASKVLTHSIYLSKESISKSTHCFRMDNLTATNCMKQGIELLKSIDHEIKSKSVEWFLRAYKIAEEKGKINKIIDAMQYLGHAHRVLMESSSNEEERINQAIFSVRYLSSVLDLEKNFYLDNDKKKIMIQDLQFVVNEFFKMTNYMEDEVKFHLLKRFMRSLDISKSIKNEEWLQIVFQCRIKEADFFLEKVEACIGKGNFKCAQIYLKELNFPKEKAKMYARSSDEAEKLKELIDTIEMHSSHVQALYQIESAEELLKGVKNDDPDSIDKVLLALDCLSEAKLLTKSKHEKVFIKASFYEGKIFMNDIMNKEKAKSCFQELLQFSVFISTDELRESELLLKQLQADMDKANRPNVNKAALLKELETELREINSADSQMTDEDFCSYLFSEFPPKHKENFKRPEMTGNPLSKKRAYIRLSTFYHPDKVDVSEHGEKYKVRCEQIAKCINGRFSMM